ncbi:MAG: phage holin family protein [Armatimonadetes bacterium]|nr:phage holin family protein [Armatimonadota bacterium]
MKGFFIRLLVNMLALWLTGLLAQTLNLRVQIESFWSAFSAVILLSVANAVIAPILRLFTMPINCMTLGLIGILINAFLFWIVGLILPGFEVRGFWAAIFGSVVMGLLNGLLLTLLQPDQKRK